MAKSKKDFGQLASQIIEKVGGKDNIVHAAHCMTRLRVTTKDTGLVDIDEIKKLGVIGAQMVGDQLQVIIGNDVPDVYEEFLKQTAKQPGVTTQPSGLQYRVLRQGTGPIATASDQVEVKYEGRLVDGTIFDSSYKRNPQTTKFRPTDVIKGWTEALTMMPEGSMWELYIPYDLAYGERDMGEIKPYSTLIFRVEVEKVIKAEEKKADTPSANSPAPTPQKKVTTRKPATIKK